MKFYPKFKVRIVYKSGYFHDFWTWKFDVKRGVNGLISAEWAQAEDRNKPIFINTDQIESVWQVGVQLRFRFVSPV